MTHFAALGIIYCNTTIQVYYTQQARRHKHRSDVYHTVQSKDAHFSAYTESYEFPKALNCK